MATEKETGGASVPAPQPLEPVHLSIPKISLDGAPLSQATTHDAADEDFAPGSHPGSPFYSHPTTKTSIEQLKCLSSTQFSYFTDVEAGSARPSCERGATKGCAAGQAAKRISTRDTMWPQRAALEQEHRRRKRTRGCYPWNQMSSRQKLLAKIVIALLVVAIGVGIGVGVSIAVHGTYYSSQNQQAPVGNSQN